MGPVPSGRLRDLERRWRRWGGDPACGCGRPSPLLPSRCLSGSADLWKREEAGRWVVFVEIYCAHEAQQWLSSVLRKHCRELASALLWGNVNSLRRGGTRGADWLLCHKNSETTAGSGSGTAEVLAPFCSGLCCSPGGGKAPNSSCLSPFEVLALAVSRKSSPSRLVGGSR